jgi:hypothetical protein
VAQQHLLQVVDVDGVVVGTRPLVEGGAEAVGIRGEDQARDVLRRVRRHLREVGRTRCGEVGGLAVVLAQEAEDHRAPRRLAGELDRALDHLGAGDPGCDPRDARGRELDEPFGELDRRRAAHVVGDLEPVPVHRGDRALQSGLGLGAEGVRPPAGDMIDEGVAVHVLDQPVALALDVERHGRVLAVGPVHDRVVARHQLGAARTRQRRPHGGERVFDVRMGGHDALLVIRGGSIDLMRNSHSGYRVAHDSATKPNC